MPKQEWIERAARAAAAFGTGRDMFDEVAARVLGLNRTDLRILSAAHAAGTLSAGALATQVGLSPAATTEAVQRLIARGYLTAADAVRGWMAHRAHRANILNCRIVATGVGVKPGPGGPWWTQDFGYS